MPSGAASVRGSATPRQAGSGTEAATAMSEARDSATVRTPPPSRGASTSNGATSDATSFMWPPMHGSIDMTVLVTST